MLSLGIHGEKGEAKASNDDISRRGNQSNFLPKNGLEEKESREIALKFPQFDPGEMYVTY